MESLISLQVSSLIVSGCQGTRLRCSVAAGNCLCGTVLFQCWLSRSCKDRILRADTLRYKYKTTVVPTWLPSRLPVKAEVDRLEAYNSKSAEKSALRKWTAAVASAAYGSRLGSCRAYSNASVHGLEDQLTQFCHIPITSAKVWKKVCNVPLLTSQSHNVKHHSHHGTQRPTLCAPFH